MRVRARLRAREGVRAREYAREGASARARGRLRACACARLRAPARACEACAFACGPSAQTLTRSRPPSPSAFHAAPTPPFSSLHPCSLLRICLAAYFEFLEADKSSASYKPGPHWNGGAVTAIVIGVVAVVVGVAVQSRLGDRSHLMRSLEDEDEESDGKRGGLMLNS